MNVKISVFVICVKAITYLLKYNFHDCIFKDTMSPKCFYKCTRKIQHLVALDN